MNLQTPLQALYIDPGSGALLWQVISAACLGGILTFRSRLLTLFRKRD